MNPTIENLVSQLIGKFAKADHPITCMNPSEFFCIIETKIEYDHLRPNGRVFVRGKDTMWFGENMIDIFPFERK